MKIYPEGNRFIKDVFEGNEYGFLYDYDTVIDIGANIGTFSMWIYDHAKKIYAIEPVETNVIYLTQNKEENKLDKLSIHQMVISERNGLFFMEEDGDPLSGGWKLSVVGSYPVTGMSLKDFMDWKDIEYADLVKIDVEGSEMDIIKADNFPKDQVGTIIGECHASDTNCESVEKKLNWLGYKCKFINNMFIARK
jgi:FkbM family methyltransferase